MKSLFRHLSAFIAPFVLGLLLPFCVMLLEHVIYRHPVIVPSVILAVVGAVVWAAGLALFIVTVTTFIRIGDGTIMPWDPTKKMVIAGVYAYVRNPMILSLLVILAGEAVFFASIGVAALALLFFIVNTAYFILSEEPGLEKRFGKEYIEYKKSVRRWLPRLKPWRPGK